MKFIECNVKYKNFWWLIEIISKNLQDSENLLNQFIEALWEKNISSKQKFGVIERTKYFYKYL